MFHRPTRRLFYAIVLALAGCACQAQDAGGSKYTLVGVLQMGEELWVTLSSSEEGVIITSNGANRRVQAIEFVRSEGYALIRDANGREIKALLKAPDAFSGLSTDPSDIIPAREEISNMSQREIREFARNNPSPMMYRRSGQGRRPSSAAANEPFPNLDGRNANYRRHLVIGGGTAPAQNQGGGELEATQSFNDPENATVDASPAPRVFPEVGNRYQPTGKPSKKKSGGVVTIDNDVLLPGDRKEIGDE